MSCPHLKKFVISICFATVLSGCATSYRKSPDFSTNIQAIKTIAVLPPKVEVYKVTAGGVRELIDEWSDLAKAHMEKALKEHFARAYGFEVRFVTENEFTGEHKALWKSQMALYEAVAQSALLHAYPGPHAFPDKIKTFDYTLGPQTQEFASALSADSLLFVYGYDHEATAGRVALMFWDALLSGVTGTMIIPTNPCMLSLGLVNGRTGQVEWFNITHSENEYDFRKEKHVDKLIEWLTRDFLKEKK